MYFTTNKELMKNISEISQELIYGQDLHDMIWQDADGHQDVIYYARARDLVCNCDSDTRNEAEFEMEGCGYSFTDPDELHTTLAFFIKRIEIQREYQEDIENDIELIESLIVACEELEEEYSRKECFYHDLVFQHSKPDAIFGYKFPNEYSQLDSLFYEYEDKSQEILSQKDELEDWLSILQDAV